jgi:LCP family protein required for cell wall assembly
MNRKGRDIMRKKIKWTLISAGSILVLLIGYYIYSIVSTVNHFNKKEDTIFKDIPKNPDETVVLAPPKWEGTSRVNILILGGDERGLNKGEVPRSDSMMVVSIEPNTKKALLISVLRDTYVKIPGYGKDRINAALALGGPELAMKTVSDLLGIEIQYYVYMGFKGFIGVIDALGGVTIDVEKDMDWEDSEDDHIYDIHLKKGLQKMDGKTALQYVRFRHDAMSDFTRSERQRKFLTAISEQMQSANGILKLPKILSSVDPYIETNINFSDMLKLGSLGYDAKASGFVGIQVPPSNLLDERSINGASVLTTDPKLLQSYIQDKFVESLTGVIQPLDHMQSSPTQRPTARPTAKPTPTPIPIDSPAPTLSGDPFITPDPDPAASEAPTAQPTESPAPSTGETASPTPLPTATPATNATSSPKPTTKPVIQAAG